MVGFMEPDHLEGKGLRPISSWIPKGNRQIDLPKWHGLLSRHDVVERRSSRLDARSVDAHGIECFVVHDVEAAASIHQYLGEPLHADDWVDHEQVSSWLRGTLWVVSLIKGYGRLQPSEEGRHGRLSRIDLVARKLLVVLGVIGCRPSEDHEVAIQH